MKLGDYKETHCIYSLQQAKSSFVLRSLCTAGFAVGGLQVAPLALGMCVGSTRTAAS